MTDMLFYVALLFFEDTYAKGGIQNVIDLFEQVVPENQLVLVPYIVDGTTERTIEVLQDFLTQYPTGARTTISINTRILLDITTYLTSQGLIDRIPSFSLNASADIVKTLQNVLTYGPYEQFSVMSHIMVYTEYRMKQFHILVERGTVDEVYYQSYIDLMKLQCGLLSIPVTVEDLVKNKSYNVSRRSVVLLLASSTSLQDIYITPAFLASIPCKSYIALSPATTDIQDIFGEVPAYAIIPNPLDYTATSQLVYNSVQDKKNLFYGCYPFFDILYTLAFMARGGIELSVLTYIETNPWQELQPAFGSIAFDNTINGYNYGLYDMVLTKDTVIANDRLLYNQYNSGGIARTPDSQSIFKSIGIVPYFSTRVFYCNEDYFKFYNRQRQLVLIRFDKSTTTYKGHSIAVSENIPCQFLLSFTNDGYFSFIQNLPNRCSKNAKVNSTMSKQTVKKYIDY